MSEITPGLTVYKADHSPLCYITLAPLFSFLMLGPSLIWPLIYVVLSHLIKMREAISCMGPGGPGTCVPIPIVPVWSRLSCLHSSL